MMKESILYRIIQRLINWFAYTLILSFLPIIILFILAAMFGYDFTLSNLANLFITVCGLSVVILRDTFEIRAFVGDIFRFLMIMVCVLSSVIFSALSIMQGGNMSLAPEIMETLRVTAFMFLSVIIVIGVFTQVCLEGFSSPRTKRRSEIGK